MKDRVELLDLYLKHLGDKLADVTHFLDGPTTLSLILDFLKTCILLGDDVGPQAVAQDVDSRQKLLLGLVVLPQVRELLAELVEVANELVDQCLLFIPSLKEGNKVILTPIQTLDH